MLESDTKRLNNLLETLDEARKSLDNWQDQRTEALISLDSFTYDVRLLQEEKNQILEEYQKAQEAFQAREQNLCAQIEALNEELLAAIRAHESLQNELNQAREATQLAKTEIEKQVLVQKAMAEKFESDLERLRTDFELKNTLSRKDDLNRLDKISAELQNATNERHQQEARAKRAESELQALRNQLLGVLQQNPSAATNTQTLNAVPASVTPIVASPAEQATTVEKPARELVQDYLKRLGY